MPLYEYYCRRCDGRFDLLRPVARMDDAAACPVGHRGGKRVLSSFAAITGGAAPAFEASEPSSAGGGCGGCAGGACACSNQN